MNKQLREFYLDYFNNYLTIAKLAEHHELTVEHASLLVSIGKEAHERHCEMWHEIEALTLGRIQVEFDSLYGTKEMIANALQFFRDELT